jgi:hypothetical protein
MSRAARTALLSLALGAAALLAAACATEIGGARISARVATRIPGYVYQGGDGAPHQIEPIDPKGDALFFIVRGRY